MTSKLTFVELSPDRITNMSVKCHTYASKWPILGSFSARRTVKSTWKQIEWLPWLSFCYTVATLIRLINLTSMGPRIANVFSSITNKMQRYTIYLFLWNALHVSGGSSAHHQELKTVYKASGTLSNLYCYLPRQWQVAVKVCPNDHHLLSFTYLVHHSVFPFVHGSHGFVLSTSSQLISMSSTAQITGVIHRLEYRWTMLSGSALVNYVKIPVRSVLCVCIGSTFPTLSTTPRGTRIYVNILYVSCRWLVNKTTTIISFCFVLWRTNAQLFYKLSHFIYLFVVNWTIMMF
jgi:hypothetical protein